MDGSLTFIERRSSLPLTIPLELWEQVIDELAPDHAALRACSLTHRACVSSTRRYLFRVIALKGRDDYKRFRDILLSSLSVGTDIARHVREVTITKDHDIYALQRPSDDELIEDIFSKLPNVTCLRLNGIQCELPRGASIEEYPNTPIGWSFTLPRLRSLHLVSVVFNSPYDTMMLLAAFPQVTSFHLHYLLHNDQGPTSWPPLLPDDGETYPSVYIQELNVAALSESMTLLTALRHPPFTCVLRKLVWARSLSPTVEEEDLLLDLVSEAEDTLEELEIHCAADSEVFDKMDLSRHSHLKFLCIAAVHSINTPTAMFSSSFPLFLLRVPDNLRALQLPIYLVVPPEIGNCPWAFVNWEQYDALFAQLHRYKPELALHMHLHFRLPPGGAVPPVAEPLAMRLSSALRAGMRVKLIIAGFVPGTGGYSIPEEHCWLQVP